MREIELETISLEISQILRMFFNTLTVDAKYSLRNRENLRQASQMQLSKKQKTLIEFFLPLLKFASKFQHFVKKIKLIAYVFPKLRTVKVTVR